ncbi:NADPH:quinone reductase-like Zn-dependent oxidoreductase [Paenibacillus phyllosphaerae]|uniref:NADPH:quinone reductase-like Zn-dependent oxidoreductase n=1 Tax=Paenibacillus phyllosphaerae TaxID=274593 RepID=A0A7W5B041_9BACL|nr:NAD(P)-dependent alcohol dehydrogenase [Paenibacillus phyllosphaerae]MBB3111812.1 NADPH:quinone reductase-like Zn-dependent oxidoreductase [Paenibacillus phyllosphaerae]
MKAVLYGAYGPPDVLKIREVAKPVPKDHEILVKIHATSVTAGDCRMRRADPFAARLFNGLVKPSRVQTLGFELSGEVEAIGSKITRYQIGDAIFASCGFGFGAYAEYRCLPEDGIIALKPSNLDYTEAAAVPIGGGTALRYLRAGGIKPGQQVLIYGASGSVGTYAVQLAALFGAEVTAVCSTDNVAMVKALGAKHVIDYTKSDFSQFGEQYDLIFDTVGKSRFASGIKALKPQGYYVSSYSVGLSPGVNGLWLRMSSGKKLRTRTEREKQEDLLFLKARLEAGELRPVIDRCYSLEQIVEAHRYVDTGRKKGNVVIQVVH